MEYLLITANDEHDLSLDVNNYLSQGWKLYGSPIMCFEKNIYREEAQGVIYAQAIIKKTEKSHD